MYWRPTKFSQRVKGETYNFVTPPPLAIIQFKEIMVIFMSKPEKDSNIIHLETRNKLILIY